MVDVGTIRADKSRLEAALVEAGCEKHGGKWKCGFHEDRNPSGGIYQRQDGSWAYKCQVCGVGGDVLDIIQRVRGIGFREACDALGVTGGNGNGHKPERKEIMAEYDYTDESGNLLFQAVRFRPKGFRQRHRDDNGEWVWNLRDVRRVLFRLPSLMQSISDPVYIVEGEKDVVNLVKLGFVATCNPMGAGKWRDDYSDVLAGRDCIIIGDKDKAGRDHVQQVAKSLQGKAASVKAIELPGPGKDASDWIEAGGTREQLIEIVEQAPEWKPSLSTADGDPGPVDGFALTDTGNAERLAAMHGNDLRFLRYGRADSGHWLVWQGTHWAPDDRGEIWQRAKDTVRGIYKQAADDVDDTRRAALAKWAARSEGEHAIKGLVSLSRSEAPIPITPGELDNDTWLLNVQNGSIDLHTGTLRPHDRRDYITKICPVAYNPEAEAPRFTRFLDEVLPGMDEVQRFLCRLVGYWLTGDIRDHVLPILHGSGRNGKNCFLDTIMGLMGDYAAPAPASLLTARRTDEHPTEVADACGKRLLVASETDEGRHLRVALVKSLTGDAYLKGRYMRQDYFTFDRTHKLVLVTNNRPRIRERSAAIWARVLMIPFNVSFAGREDTRLPDKLRAEWPGILAWAVRGCLEWQRDGLRVPEAIRAATAEYQTEQDVVGPFIEDCCIIDPNTRVSRAGIWERYIDWAKRAGEKPVDRNGLYARLRERGFADTQMREHGRKCHGFEGIGLAGGTDGTPGTPVLGMAPMRDDLDVIPKSAVPPVPPVPLEAPPAELLAHWENET